MVDSFHKYVDRCSQPRKLIKPLAEKLVHHIQLVINIESFIFFDQLLTIHSLLVSCLTQDDRKNVEQFQPYEAAGSTSGQKSALTLSHLSFSLLHFGSSAWMLSSIHFQS